jgi:hypothetical protein
VARFEWRYTPLHGSWLNMAESKLAALCGQCLGRRLPERPTLEGEVTAGSNAETPVMPRANWRFTTANAGIKLKSLYPSL